MTPLIRTIRPEDHNFILATWLNSYYSGMKDYRPRKAVYFKHHQELAKLKLTGNVRIVCNKEDQDQIMGYAVIENSTLHYIYVKNVFRGFGLAKKLLENVTIEQVSHLTDDLKKLIEGPIFNPYLFR